MYDLLSRQHSTHCSLSLSDSAQKHILSVALAPTCMKPIWPYTTNTMHVILATKWSYVINIKNPQMSLAFVYIYVSNSYVVFYSSLCIFYNWPWYKMYLKTIKTPMIFEDLASIKVFYQFNLIRTMNLCISFWSRLKHSKTYINFVYTYECRGWVIAI